MSNLRKRNALRLCLMVFFDMISVALAIVLGFKLRFGFSGALPRVYEGNLIYYILIMSLIAIMSNIVIRCYSSVWRYFGYKDLLRQLLSTLITSVFVVLIDNFINLQMPIEMFVIIPSLMYLFMILVRCAPKAYYELINIIKYSNKKESVRTLVYGAGEAGSYLLATLKNEENKNSLLVGFIDDNPSLWGRQIGQAKVIGGEECLELAIEDLKVDEVILAIPSASKQFVRELYIRCNRAGVELKQYGTLSDVSAEDFKKAAIKKVNLEELLRRVSVQLNMNVVNRFIENKTVLVTGGVGSIGSEICRQVLKFGAKKLLIFDINENGLFFIKNEFDEAGYEGRFETLLGSVRDEMRIEEVFEDYKPEIVFHAAAHKHVPMMECNPKEAIKNNVIGTINVANQCIKSKSEKFILISTDKAVNPTNIMGASKRIAEIAIQIMNNQADTELAAVRFGNVLGSNGSVVPFFEKQIEDGGPVTVTHRDMKRYFMTIPEAVQLVLEAGAMAQGGEIFVLDMGEPVYIYDLACDLIRMHGLEPNKDIEIKITGLRPGEKLFEEISLADEDTVKTENNKIYINKPQEHDKKTFFENVEKLCETIREGKLNEMFEQVKMIVPTFNHNNKEQ